MVPEPTERMCTTGFIDNIRSTVNPMNGDQYGPNDLKLLSKVEKIFIEEGQPKGW